MTFWGQCTGLAAAVLATACLNDPSAPAVYLLEVRPDTIRFMALGDTVRPLVVTRRLGGYTAVPFVRFATSDSAVATVTPDGLVTSHRVGSTRLSAYAPDGLIGTAAVNVRQAIAHVGIPRDTIRLDAISATESLDAVAKDPLGSPVESALFNYLAGDSSIATVSSTGVVRAHGNGLTMVWAYAGAESSGTVVRVSQRPTQVDLGEDTVRFDALGVDHLLSVVAKDSLGFPLPGLGTVTGVSDSTVIQVVDSHTVRSVRNGAAIATVSVAGQIVQLPLVVAQIARSIVVHKASEILSVPRDSVLPISCEGVDANGSAMTGPVIVAPSSAGRWSGQTCDGLRLQHSGLDTLRLSFDSVQSLVPVPLAVRAVVTPDLGQYLQVDSMPTGTGPWASSMRINPAGEYEVYFADYTPDTTNPGFYRSNLHRFVSSDGLSYRYDGVVLSHDDSLCTLNGSGIENVAIVPRADAAGWRMYYSSGSFSCYGWQVFSAVSSDGRNWTKEPGIRLSNGGSAPPAPPSTPPWPVGEGMAVELLPSGEWRMFTGGYRHIATYEDKFQIVEWRSVDQLTWRYVGPVFTTDQLPAGGQRSVYSPTIQEFAPGMWRMVVTADDLNVPGGRSRLWSLVSTDETNWQLEGELLSAEGNDFLYSSMANGTLVFIRHESGGAWRLATAAISMP